MSLWVISTSLSEERRRTPATLPSLPSTHPNLCLRFHPSLFFCPHSLSLFFFFLWLFIAEEVRQLKIVSSFPTQGCYILSVTTSLFIQLQTDETGKTNFQESVLQLTLYINSHMQLCFSFSIFGLLGPKKHNLNAATCNYFRHQCSSNFVNNLRFFACFYMMVSLCAHEICKEWILWNA